jgi:spermidine/putrescine transport system substrate-binding protein
MSEGAPRHQRMSRRAFIRRAGGLTVATPGLAAILAACSKPGATGSNNGSNAPYPIARQDDPVTLPLNGQPVATDAPMEDGVLQIFNWSDYMWKRVLEDWDESTGLKHEWTPFNNMADAMQKLNAGQVNPDVFFPTVDQMGKLTAAGLVQPLNHDLLPNIADDWPEFSGTHTPFYDQGWRYTVPYTIYTTGISFRRDHVDEAEVREKGFEIFWDPKYKGKVGIYDDYRESLGMAMMRRHGSDTDVNTGDPAIITQAKEDLLELIDLVSVRYSINGSYAKLPENDYWLHLSWSGDIIGAQYYLPKGVGTDVLGFVLPETFAIGNDLITVGGNADHPVMAHNFLNYFIGRKPAFKNFSWNGYQPPLTSIDPDTLVADEWVPSTVSAGVVRPEQFDSGKFYLELTPEVERLWQDAWDEFTAGAGPAADAKE